jgi:hypothetical protein
MPAPGRPQVLYLTTVDRLTGAAGLSRETRIVVGVLARDFDLSLAIAGPIDHQELQKLRDHFASVRAAGGFPASSADQPAVDGLRGLAKARLGTDIVNARLQAAIQRRAEAFDAVVIDDMLATPYLPARQTAPVYYLAHRCESKAQSGTWWHWLRQREQRALSQCEKGALQSVSAVFAKPEVAGELLAQGLSLRQLNPSFGHFRPEIALGEPTTWRGTLQRVGYAGYLGDDRNLASLEWLLREVWTPGQRTLADIELHLVGMAPPSPLRELAAANNNVYLHSGSRHQLRDLGCRAVIEPLMFEQHVDTKLINAMSQGLPVITTREGVRRAHAELGEGVLVAAGPEQMSMTVHQLMNDQSLWQLHASAATRTAALQLVDFEVAHDLRRALLRVSEERVSR